VTLQIESLLEALRNQILNEGENGVPDSLLVMEATGQFLRVRLLVDSIRWQHGEDGPKLQRLSGHLLMEPQSPQ